MFGETGQGGGQRIDELRPQAARGPILERTQFEFQANDGKTRIQRRTNVDGTFENTHVLAPPRMRPSFIPLAPALGAGGRQSFAWTSPPGAASRVCRLNVAPATKMCNRSPSTQTGWPSLTSPMDE